MIVHNGGKIQDWGWVPTEPVKVRRSSEFAPLDHNERPTPNNPFACNPQGHSSPKLTVPIGDCVQRLLNADGKKIRQLGKCLSGKGPPNASSMLTARILSRVRKWPTDVLKVPGDEGLNWPFVVIAGLIAELQSYCNPRGEVDLARFISTCSRYGSPGPVELLFLDIISCDFAPLVSLRKVFEQEKLQLLMRCVPRATDHYLESHHNVVKRLDALEWMGQDIPDDHFAGHVIVAAQHLLGTQVPLFDKLIEKGAKPSDIVIAGVPYSSDPAVTAALQHRGIEVLAAATAHSRPRLPSDYAARLREALRTNNRAEALRLYELSASAPVDALETTYDLGNYEKVRLDDLRLAIASAAAKAQAAGKRLLVMDDGGLINKLLHEEFPELLAKTTIVEQTTRGITEANALDLKCPVINIARSPGKNREAPFIAHSVLSSLVELLPQAGIDRLEGVPITLVSCGTVGLELVKLCLRKGMVVRAVDEDPAALEHARTVIAQELGEEASSRLSTFTDTIEAARGAQILLASTGHRSITPEILDNLPSGIVLASGSSAEVEIDVDYLREASSSLPRLTRFEHSIYAADMCTEADGLRTRWLKDRSILLARGGRPINFTRGKENIPASAIQLTRALMLQGAAEAVAASGGEPGLREPDHQKQEDLIAELEPIWQQVELPAIEVEQPALNQARPIIAGQANHGAAGFFAGVQSLMDKKLIGGHGIDDVLFACPVRFPMPLRDASFWGRVGAAVDGTLIIGVNATGYGMLQELPSALKGEKPIHMQLLGTRDRRREAPALVAATAHDLEFLLWTEDEQGTKRAHHLRIRNLSHLNDRFREVQTETERLAEIVATYTDASMLSLQEHGNEVPVGETAQSLFYNGYTVRSENYAEVELQTKDGVVVLRGPHGQHDAVAEVRA